MNSIKLKEAIEFSLQQIDKGMESFTNGKYPDSCSVNGIYPAVPNDVGWIQGFWSGMLWLAYEFTNEMKYKNVALSQVDDFYERIKNRLGVDHHDMGFLYIPSCVAAYKLTKNEKAKEAAIMAADHLCSRYHEKGRFIQAWGDPKKKEDYRLIIDCLLNIPLLFWTAKITGEEKYKEIATAHLETSVNVLIREDGSTFHTFFFDPQTGEPKYGETHQGYAADSIWARGQAWGIYGLALAYKNTRNPEYITMFNKVTELFISHLPKDNIPAWDLIFTDTETLKDTSSAAIAVCGILEMSRNCKVSDSFLDAASNMMEALQNSCYTKDISNSNGILKHAVYAMPQNIGVDECNIWGDYYYMEALMRYNNPDWDSYWEE